MIDVDICVLSHLKEELTWAVDKRFWIISTKMLFINSKTTKEVKGTSHFILLYTLLCGP